MSTTDLISPDLRTVLRRLRLSPILDTLPERLALARQQQITHQDFLLLVLADETARRDSLATSLRVQRARLEPAMQLVRIPAMADTWTGDGGQRRSVATQEGRLFIRLSGMLQGGALFTHGFS